jgi:nitroreductase
MDVRKAILERYAARDFKSEPVSKETLVKIMETALRSPSTGNGQPWQVFVAGGEATEKITRAYLDRFAEDVPANLRWLDCPLLNGLKRCRTA